MTVANAPGTWEVRKLERPQARPFYVCRDISPGPSFSHWEQLQEEGGGCASFETEEEARSAIAKSPAQKDGVA